MIKGIVAYLNYGHTHAWDNYYTKLYIINHLIEQKKITLLYYIRQRYIRCVYISTNSKIYDILHPPPLGEGSSHLARHGISELINYFTIDDVRVVGVFA